jgi:hypothetical protein
MFNVNMDPGRVQDDRQTVILDKPTNAPIHRLFFNINMILDRVQDDRQTVILDKPARARSSIPFPRLRGEVGGGQHFEPVLKWILAYATTTLAISPEATPQSLAPSAAAPRFALCVRFQ